MTGSGLAQRHLSTSQDGESSRFDTTLTELAIMAEALSAAPDPLAFHRIARDELGRLQHRTGARSAHVVVAWGERADQRIVVHGPEAVADDRALVAELLASAEWSSVVPDHATRCVDVGTAPAAVATVMARHEVTTMWVVGCTRSVPGNSHAVFTFSSEVEPLTPLETTALGIHVSLLISRAITRLAGFEWDELVRSWGGDRSSYVFATDHDGRLLRWPFPLAGIDRRLAAQIHERDRRPVVAALEALLAGSSSSYEAVVSLVEDDRLQPLRLMMRRSPEGGVDGIVLPPDVPVAALPNHLLERLTAREQEVVRLIAEGLRVRQVGERLFLSQHTVRNHLKSIFAELSVSSQAELIALVNEPASSVAVAG